MKYFLVFILSCLSFAHGAKTKSTDTPSDSTATTKPVPTNFDGFSDELSSSPLFKSGFNVSKTASKFMATIRENPSELYLCSATFIRNDTLLTTARCLLGRDITKLFVHSNSTSLETNGRGNLRIKIAYLHPDFDMNPVMMDFALIILEKPANGITPVHLPDKKIGRPGSEGTMYTWRFAYNSSKFLIHEQKGRIISDSKCFVIDRQIMAEGMACAEVLPFEEGYFDHGMPFTIKKKGKTYMFGISEVSTEAQIHKVEKIWTIYEIVPWINEVLKEIIQKPSTTTPANVEDKDNDNDDDVEEYEDEEEDIM